MLTRGISAAWIRGVREVIKGAGLDVDALFREAGLNIHDLEKPDAWFPSEKVSALWDLAVERSNNPALALSMPDAFTPLSMGAIGYVMMSSPTLLSALRRAIRYMRILSSAARIDLDEEKGGYAFKIEICADGTKIPRQRGEGVVANVLKFCRWLTGKNLRPVAIDLPHPSPQNLQPYIDFFQCPLHFGAKIYCLHFASHDLALPLSTADPVLANLHEKFVLEHLSRLENDSLGHKVRELIVKRLPDGDPSRADIARDLHVSERTLQRHLQEEGIAYSELLDDTRRELAEQYFAQQDLTLAQIAYLLGFRTHSTFFRTSKRWFGMPPGEYRTRICKQAE